MCQHLGVLQQDILRCIVVILVLDKSCDLPQLDVVLYALTEDPIALIRPWGEDCLVPMEEVCTPDLSHTLKGHDLFLSGLDCTLMHV